MALKLPAVLELSHQTYHADDIPGLDAPTLSRSIADALTTKSPYHAYKAHPKLGGGNDNSATKDMENGTALHDYLLGSGPEVVIVDAPDWRYRKAPAPGFTVADPGALRDEIVAAGKIAMLPKEEMALAASRVTIKEALDRRVGDWEAAIAGMERESTIVWEEDGVIWRCRLDLWRRERGIAWDLKFTASADDEAIARKMRRENLAFQSVCYTAGMDAVMPELVGRNELEFLFIEFDGTACRFGGPGPGLILIAENQRRRAVRTWKRCLETNDWPGYPDKKIVVDAASWQLAADLDKDLSEGREEPEWLR